ncbi:CapA family protein [Wukongibacter sp. M2B1]|uniref:CapA family protein n=1 Tax=Wukongibacter sp. M2B1 TaxID=3088895 RepID=UPI003D7BA992
MKDFFKIFTISLISFMLLALGGFIAMFEQVKGIDESDSSIIVVENVEELEDKNRPIKISFAGDCILGNYEGATYAYSLPWVLKNQNNNYGYFLEKVKPIFEKDDLTLVNLENPLTSSNERSDKQFSFRGDPSYVNILKAGSIEMVNIANNHIYDYSKKGFLDTIDVLKKSNIHYSGEGYIAYYNVRNVTVASLGYRGWSTYIKPHISKDIKEAKEKADIVLVSFHWGEENMYYPNDVQKTLGRFAIDEGADIVVGHHPHVIQGIEEYKNKYIVYSLGNFCFGGNKNPKDKDTFIFQAEFTVIDKKITKIQGNIIPCSISSVKNINNYQPVILEGIEKERVLNKIYKY